jgi:hypothetical protein
MQLRCRAELPSLIRILVSHGSAIDDNPSGSLHEQAASTASVGFSSEAPLTEQPGRRTEGQRSTFGPAR